MAPRDVGSIWIAGHDGEVDRADGVASTMSDLGAPVRLLDLWGAPLDGGPSALDATISRILILEVLDRPDLLDRSLKSLRQAPSLRECPVLAVIGPRSIGQLEPGAGHDDFLVWPSPPSELYARVRSLEWRASEYASDEVVKLGPLVINIAAREVSLSGIGAGGVPGGAGAEAGEPIALTAREFSLLVALATRRGRVLTRETLLDVVWGADYDGGQKTVDVHVRRLRAKLGEALPLQTVRGAGYVLR